MKGASEENYRYLRADMPNIKDRKEYCQKQVVNAVKACKNSQLSNPIPIRVEPSPNTAYPLVSKTMIVDNNTQAGRIYFLLREAIRLNKTDGLYLYCGNLLVMYGTDLRALYDTKK